MTKIWNCKIGECDETDLKAGADAPMRDAIERAYIDVTGKKPDFLFSGWGAELTQGERAVVENRAPDVMATALEGTVLRGSPERLLSRFRVATVHAVTREEQYFFAADAETAIMHFNNCAAPLARMSKAGEDIGKADVRFEVELFDRSGNTFWLKTDDLRTAMGNAQTATARNSIIRPN